MPIGSRTSSWPSMMNSWRSTCRICWSVGMLTARAVSSARSTSSAVTSRSLIATMPVELKLRMWLPAMPTKAEAILQSAISSASSSARCTAATVASMLTTTPFFMPFDSCPPMPRTSSAPSARSSATRHATFEVPMSRATMRFLFSFGIALPLPRHARGETVRIAQVDVLEARRPLALRRGEDRDEALEPTERRLLVTSEHQVHAAVEPQLPGVARREHHLVGARAERRERLRKAGVTARHLRLGAARADEERHNLFAFSWESLAVRVHQAAVAPARERDVLFDLDLEPVGPDAAHADAAHPGQRLQRLAHIAQT